MATPESVLPAPEEELRMPGGDARGAGACGKPAEEERGPAADSDGHSLLTTVPRYPKLGRVTHDLCSQGPIANCLGSDWCEERVVRL